ncbi:hypothetical protein BGZ76_008757 [Entomortierella beljakovae]|nr:hypothetical protein BGZ76_008757 [Entomortierella beljakovae]
MGNAHLPSLLVASFPSAHGMYSAAKSRSALDKYKTVLLITYESPSIDFRPNADYNTTISGRSMGNEVPDISQLPPVRPTRYQQLIKLIKETWTSYFGVSRKVAEEWHGLPRYNHNISNENLKANKFSEYAMVRNILQCNRLGFRYCTDVAGKVPDPSENGPNPDVDLPPEWGLELIIDEAVISYGPWADRQRAEIQNFFFPNTFRTFEQTPEAQPGQDRIHAMLQFMDWKYMDPEFQAVQGGKSMRPFGWLEFKAAHGSMIQVDIPMIFGLDGYKNMVLVDLQNLVVTTSVNYAPLFSLKELKMVCQLQNPLIWNAQRDWDFEFTLDTAKAFILRDHITLIQDLSKDWTAGPSVDMAHFVPFKYEFDIKLPNFQFYTYVNEHNIINEPTETDENAFIIAAGQSFDCKVVLPFVQYNPEITAITFDVEIRNGGLEIQLPLAHTLGEFSTTDSKNFTIIPSVVIKGTYEYYDFVDSAHLESLNLDVKGNGVTIKLFGNVIRYVLILMDNYAGLYVNFVTMEEYRQKRNDTEDTERTEQKQANAKPPSDPYEVYVHFVITDTTLMLPENLYSAENYSEITCAELQLDMRNLDVYMGIDIYAHRLFGPLPKTTTYVANWKLDIGSIYGQIKPSFLLGVSSFAKAFAYNLKDGDNAFPPEYATVTPPDITIVDLNVKEVDVSIWGEDVVSQVLLKDGVIIHFDDIINERYIGRVVLKMQSLLVRSMALTDPNKDEHTGEAEPVHHEKENAPWVEIASLDCAFDVTVYLGAGNWKERREKQQTFVREQDRETLRCPYIYARKGYSEQQSVPHPNLKDNHFGTIYVPPLTFDPAAMRGNTANSIIEAPSENGSIIEYDVDSRTPSRSQRHQLHRSASMFSIGTSVGSDDDTGSDSNDSQINNNWSVSDSEEFDNDYSSSEEFSGSEFGSAHMLTDSDEPEFNSTPSVPARSIPYSHYLKRYAVSSTRSTNYRNPYLHPPRIIFARPQSIEEECPRHHPRANFEESFDTRGWGDGSVSSAQPKGADNSDEERVTIVFDATQDVKVLLTPILLKIIQEFLEAINAEEWDLETMLDVTQMEYVELLTRIKPSKSHSSQILMSIPRVHMRIIQDVMMPDALNGGDDINMIKTRYELSGANLCVVDIVLDETAAIAAVKLEDENFEAYEPEKIHIASFKVVEARANVDFSKFKMNARFVSASVVKTFGIPDERHQFSHLGIRSLPLLKEPVIADISFDQFKLRLVHSFNPNHFSATLERLSVLFISQSAEIVAGSICSWLTFVKDLKTILTRFRVRRSKQLQTLFSEIARFSAQANINTDPVFLTRPSTTLRLGTMIHRPDDGWKLLAHIRHCMRLMPKALTDTLQEALKKPELETFNSDTMYDIVIAVFSNWRSWEMDDLRLCRLFLDVFEKKRIQDNNAGLPQKESWMYDLLRYSTNSIQLGLGELEAAIYDDSLENRMKVTGLEFIFESRYKPDVITQTTPATDETNRLTTGFLDVAVKTGFKSTEVDVNPVIIAFTRHILRIDRIFRPQFDKILESSTEKRPTEVRRSIDYPSSPRQSLQLTREITTTSSVDNEPSILQVIDRFDVVFNGMAVVETIRVTLMANKLQAQVIVTQIQISALNFAKQRTFPNQDIEGISIAKSTGSNPEGSISGRSGFNKLIASVATNISSINASLKERIYPKEYPTHVTPKDLLTFGIAGINSEATLSQFTPTKRPKQSKVSIPREVINLLVTFKQITIALPRSILTLYIFARDWREENMQSFDFLFQGVVNEWDADRKSQPKAVVPSTPRELKVQIVLKTFTLESQMLPSLLFQYEAGDLMIMLHDVPHGLPFSAPQLTYSAQLLRQSVDFIANQARSKADDRSKLQEDKHAASFSLPVIRASGSVMNVVDSTSPVRTRRSSMTALARGERHPKKLESSVSFDFVEMTLNVNMLDHILTAQSLLGSEANELIEILAKGSKSNAAAATPVSAPVQHPSDLLYSVKVSLAGLSIAAVSPSAVLYFESDLLKGVITNNPDPAHVSSYSSEVAKNKLAWRLYAHSITLSLNHHAGNIRMGSRAEDIRARKLRLAYITISLNVQNFSPNKADKDRFAQSPVSSFYVSLIKVHALMQPQSVSRIIGLYSYYTHELERRKELKASEMAKLADNTKKIIKSLDVEVPVYKDNTRSMLDETEITLNIDDVAVSIPLDHREDIMDSGKRLVEAFLISATSISVLTKSGETSSGSLNQLCAQFVPEFDQSKDDHFRSRRHPKMNRLIFPSISCQVEASKDSPGHQNVSSKASVKGFELDIDPNIVRYINTLTDVYDNSKGLVTLLTVEQAASAVPTKSDGTESLTVPKSGVPSSEAPQQASSNVIWKIENTFQCSKSVCRFYPKSYASKLPKKSKFMESESNFANIGAEVSGVDRFIIPGLSLWTSLRVPIGDNVDELEEAGPMRVHAEVSIHSCDNMFYPSLVPFFQDIVSGLKVGIRRQRNYSEPGVVIPGNSANSHSGELAVTVAPPSEQDSTLQHLPVKRQEIVVTCYLIIEKTTIEFNCQPMAKVMSVLTIEQGNILTSYNSDRVGNTSATVVGTFGGASSDTRHIFSQDKGFRLETKGMIFNAVAETKRLACVNKKTLSVAVDFRQIITYFDLRQAEILVLMKMIWMDQANYLIRDGISVSRSASSSQGFESTMSSQPSITSGVSGDATAPVSGQGGQSPGKIESSFLGYNVFVMARLQQIRITGDLGSQIGKVDFKLDEVKVRTKLRPFHPRSASVSIGPLELRFLPMKRGWLEGYLIIEGVNLDTLSKVSSHASFPCSIVEIILQTGRMTSMLSYDYKRFFIMAVDPIRLVMQDHWNGPDLNRDVSMAISAHLQDLRLLAGAKTVPVFNSLISRFTTMMDQKVSAAKEELKKPLLSVTNLQPVNPMEPQGGRLSTTPSISDLKDKFHAAWNAVGLVQLSMGDLNLSFFPYFLSDKECTHASVQGVKLKLDRYLIYPEVDTERPTIHRLMSISLNLFGLQKYTLQHIEKNDADMFTLEQWFERIRNPSSTTIAKLPATICGIDRYCNLEELSIRNYKDDSVATGSPNSKSVHPNESIVAAAEAMTATGGNTGDRVPMHPLSRRNSQPDALTVDTSKAVQQPAIGPLDMPAPISAIEGKGLGQNPANAFNGLTSELTSTISPTSPVPMTTEVKEAVGEMPNPLGISPGSIPLPNVTNGQDSSVVNDIDVSGAPQSETQDPGFGQEKLIFKAREQIVFKPALDVLPNTPLPLGQLGFKKEDIPPIVHIVTSVFETGLLTVAGFHSKKIEMSGLHDLWEGRVITDDEVE